MMLHNMEVVVLCPICDALNCDAAKEISGILKKPVVFADAGDEEDDGDEEADIDNKDGW